MPKYKVKVYKELVTEIEVEAVNGMCAAQRAPINAKNSYNLSWSDSGEYYADTLSAIEIKEIPRKIENAIEDNKEERTTIDNFYRTDAYRRAFNNFYVPTVNDNLPF